MLNPPEADGKTLCGRRLGTNFFYGRDGTSLKLPLRRLDRHQPLQRAPDALVLRHFAAPTERFASLRHVGQRTRGEHIDRLSGEQRTLFASGNPPDNLHRSGDGPNQSEGQVEQRRRRANRPGNASAHLFEGDRLAVAGHERLAHGFRAGGGEHRQIDEVVDIDHAHRRIARPVEHLPLADGVGKQRKERPVAGAVNPDRVENARRKPALHGRPSLVRAADFGIGIGLLSRHVGRLFVDAAKQMVVEALERADMHQPPDAVPERRLANRAGAADIDVDEVPHRPPVGGQRGGMQHEIATANRRIDRCRVAHVPLDHLHAGSPQRLDARIPFPHQRPHAIPVPQAALHEVRADKPGSSGNENCFGHNALFQLSELASDQ